MNHRFVNIQKIAHRFSFGWITPALMLFSLASGLQAQQITLVTTTIPGGTVAFPYSTQLVKSGGTGIGTSYSITAGALPAGVTLNASTGLISGTPTAAGTFTPTIQVTDTSTTIDSKSFSMVVRASGILNTRWQGTQGTTQTYTGGAVIGSGGDQWNSFFVGTGTGSNLLDNAGVATPIGVSWTSDIAWHNLSRNGFCTPTPNGFCPLMNGYLAKNGGVVANVNFSGLPANSSWDMLLYQQIDSGGSRRISVTINGTTTAATTTDNSGTDSTFIQGKNYLVVTANTDGSGNFNVAYRGVGPDPEGDINGIQLRPHVSGASITQTVAPSGPVSTAYNLALTATGGSGTGRVWSIASGSLPPGLTLNSSTGVLSGTPTATGTYNFTVMMVDSAANTATQAFTLNIQQATSTTLSAVPSSLTSTLGSAFSLTATVTPSNAAGKVAFYDGNAILGFKTLSSGTATLSYPLLASAPTSGPHRLKAVYLGDSLSITSASAVRNQIVASRPQSGFATAVSSATGANPWGVTTGDFNNDGIPDAVVANFGSVPGFAGGGTTVSTFLGTGNPAAPFGAQTTTTVATGPINVAAGDFNEDGNLDLAVAAYSTATVSILLGNGSGGFTTSSFSAGVGNNPNGFALADFNGDGHVDMAIANNASGNVSVLFGTGTGTFTASATYTTGPNPSEVVAADLNGDQIADLVVTNFSNFVTVLMGQANGLFSAATNYVSGGAGPASLAVGDFNGDGNVDVAVSHLTSGNIGILLGTGTGALGTATMFAAGSEARFVKTGDFNGDGILDLVVTNNAASNILVLTGNGSGTFNTAVAYNVAAGTTGSIAAAVADFNGDGVTDVVAVNNGSNTISTFTGTAVTTTTLTSSVNPSNFQQNVTLTATVSPSTATGTITFKDGAATIGSGTLSAGSASMSISNLTSGAHSLTAVYGGNTTNLTSTSSVLTQTVRTAVVVSTTTLPNGQNGTAYSQTLAATGGVAPYTWSINSGALPSGVTLTTGGVLSGTPSVTGTFNFTVLATDSVNGVGAQALSLVVSAASLPATVTSLSVVGCCTFGYNDSISLQATVTQGGNSVGSVGSVAFFAGTKILGVAPVSSGTATFTTKFFSSGTPRISATYVANGTYASSKSSGQIIFLGGRAGVGFATASSFGSGGVNPYSVAMADVTGDGIPDLVVAHSGGTPSSVGVLRGNGSGGFAAAQNFSVGTGANGVAVADLNGDGKLDIAVANNGSNNVSILLNTSPNNATLTFATAVNYAVGTQPQSVVVADFNGDGIADLAVNPFSSPVTVNVFFGVGNGTFPATPSMVLTGLNQSATALEAGDFNSDGHADIAVGTGGNLIVFLNTGSGTFGGPNTLPFAPITNPVSLTVADFNADGKDDLALANYQPSPNGTVVILLNNTVSSPSFNASTFTAGANPSAIAVGGFTGNLVSPSLAAANLGNDNVSILAESSGSFTSQGTVAVGSFPRGIVAGDFNGDSTMDLATANSGGGVSVLLGIHENITELTSSVNPTNFGQTTTLTATVSPCLCTGSITFKDGATTIGTASLVNGVATLNVSSLSSGTHSLTAVYPGDTTNSTSTSSPVSQVVRTPVTISTNTLPLARNGTAYSQTLAATGGTNSFTWSVSAGSLPAGVTLSPGGVLSGTPTVTGTFNFTARATDSAGGIGTQALSLIVNAANSVFNGQQVQLTWHYPDLSTIYLGPQTATVGAGVEFPNFFSGNTAFNVDFADTTIQINSNYNGCCFGASAFNGLTITNPGGLPNFTNVTLTASNWTDGGSVTFDSSRVSFDATHIYLNFQGLTNQVGMGITLQVNGISLPATIPGSSVGFPYSTQLTTTGGTGTGRVYALTSGALPNGLTLNTSTGVISGIPTTAGTFTPTLQVTDSGSNTTSKAYSVVIRQAGLLNTRWQGSPSTVYTGPGFIGNGSDTWNLFETGSGSGTLVDNAGQATPVGITWTADGAANNQPFDSNAFCYPSPTSFCALMGNYLYKSGGTTGNITFSNLTPNASWDIYLYQQIQGSNLNRQISITANGVNAATTIPNDRNDSSFILNKNYLLTSATTNGSGQLSINFQGTAADLEANINGIQLRPHLNPLTITQTTLPAGTVGSAYSTTLTTTGGTGVGNTWAIVSEVGPGGLTLSTGGVLSGTPNFAGSGTFDVRVFDSQGNSTTRTFTLLVNPAVSVTTTSLPPATNGTAYSQTLAATGGTGSYTWTITTGTLPTGLSLNASTGVISGTPSVSGTQNLTFRATDTGSSFGTSSSIALTVLQTSTVTLTTSATPSTFGASITLTASVVPGTASGTVFFYDGFSVIGQQTLASGSATLATRLLGTGPHKLRAFYKGDAAVAKNSSNVVAQTVNSAAQDRVNAGVRYASGTSPWGVATGDFNLDGKTDIVTVNNGSANVSVYLGTGNTYPGASPTNFAVGTNPMQVAVGDFNGDGKPDLAVTNNGSNNVSVLLGDGAGSFAAAANYAVGSAPKGIVAADFDGDGVIDLAVANSGGPNIVILTGTGAGTFTSSATYSAGAAPSGLVVADFNADGFPDLAVTNPTAATVSILPGAANGTLGSAVSIGTGGAGPEGIVAADFNGDGKADLAVTNSVGNNLGVFLGTGSGTFGTVSNMALNSGPAFLSAGDFNGDGIVDLAIPQTGFAVWLLTGNGTGGFTVVDTIGSASRGTALADFNGDGRTDIVFTDTAGSAIGVHLGLAPAAVQVTSSANPGVSGQTLTLTATVTPSLATGNVQFYDSGTPVGSPTSLVGGVATLSASFSTGFHFISAIYFGDTTYHDSTSSTLSLQIVDPVAVTTSSLPTGVLGAAYNFTLAATGGSGSYTWSITSGALHGGLSLNAATGAITGTPIQTGNPSVVFRATDTNGLFASTGQLTLTVNPAVSVTTTTLPGGAVGAPYSQTLAAAGGLGGYTWSITSGALPAGLALNSSTGAITGTPTVGGTANVTFRATDTGGNFGASTVALTIAGATTTSLSSSLASPSAFSANLALTATVSPVSTGKVTFYDGSSVLGIATLSGGTATLSARFLGTGTHSLRAYFQGSSDGLPSTSSPLVQVVNSRPQSGFAAGVGYAAGTGPSVGASADFNNDGKADYAVANYGASNISVYLGDGLGALTAATNFTVGLNPFALTAGDFNGDGNVDIATANLMADSISVLLGNGAGSFAAGVTYTAGVGAHPGQIIAADFNRDGFVDLATANYNSNNISVLFGAGNGTFGTGVLYTVGTNPASLAAGDFNNDGRTDLAVGNQTTNNVSILLGQTGGVFAAATNYPAGGTTLQSVITADFNADGNLDLVVTNYGTSTVTTLAGSGSGTFGTANVIATTNSPNFTVAGDFNGNGVPDIAVTNDAGNNISVLIGSGSLTFAAPVNYALAAGATTAKGITVADFNADGVSDLVVASSTSNSISVLLGVATTTTTLTSSVNPSNLGAATTLTATVSPATATGTVTFKDGAATLGTGTLSGGVATFSASFATAGVHSLTAVYAGNATNATSTSSALTQTVNQGTTTTSITSQTNPTTFAGTATFTATVVPSTATGTVTFRLGGLTLGTGTLSVGTASFSTTTLAAGAYSIDAVYAGDANYLTSTSTALTQTVNARTTTTSLSTAPNPSTSGQNVTLTATVTPSSATGSVTFKDGAATLGSGSLSNGIATVDITTLAVGGHSLTAVYDGDGNNATSTSSAVNQVVNAPLVITTSSLPNAVQNAAYNQTLTATGGSGAKTWSRPEGSVLPGGLSLGSNGVISGTPTVAGAYTFTVEVTDSLGATQNTTLVLLVNTPLTIISNTLSTGTLKFPYYGEIFASGGSGSGYTFDISAGALPPGLSLHPTTGTVSGSPTAAGVFNFTARVTDSSTATATSALTITVDGYGVLSIQFKDPSDGPQFGPAVIGNQSDLWNVFQSASGNQPILYDDAANLISVGMTFAGGSVVTTGTTSGFCSTATPYCNLMKSHLRVEAGNTGTISLRGFNVGSTWSLYLYSQSNVAGRTLSVTVNGGAPVVTSTGNPTDATFILNKNYLIIPATANGNGEINLAFTSANGLEAILNGLQVTPQVPALNVTTSSLSSGVLGSAYSQTLAGTGGTGLLYDWTISAGALPSGLTLNPTTGVISGTPSVAGTFNLTVTLEDALNYTASRALTLQVNPALSITTSTLPSGVQNVGYSQTLVASGGAGSNVWSLQSGTLPAGLTLSAGGVISGTPTATGSSTFTVRVTDASTAFASQSLTLQIAAPLNVTTSLLNQGEVGLAYTQTLSATGGVPGYTWTITSGALQSGLTLNPATGVISGTPLVAGTANLVFRATDSVGNIGSSTLVPLTISPQLVITTSSLPAGIVSVAYSQTLALSGGVAPFTWTISAGSIPGLSLATNGILSGTPQTAGTFSITARVVDALNAAFTQPLNLTVANALSISTAVVPSGSVGIPYSQPITAAGGSGSGRTFQISAGALPNGLTLAQTTGLIAGTPTTAGSFSFTVSVTDSASLTANLAYTTTIHAFGTINLQFQGSPATSYNGAGVIGTSGDIWNLFTLAPDSLLLNESHGQLTGVVASLSGDGVVNGLLQGGFCAPSPNGFCNLMNGHLFKSAGQTGNVTFSGLAPNSNWDLYVYTQASQGAGRSISLSVNGGTAVTSTPGTAADSTFILNKNYVRLSAQANGSGLLSLNYNGASGDQEGNINAIQLRPFQTPLTITQTTAPDAVTGVPYTLALTATGGTGTGRVWSISAGALPGGLTLNPSTGVVGGIPSVSGAFNFTAQVVDAQNNTGTQNFSLLINPPLTFTNTSLLSGVINVPYTETLAATGGFGGYVWSIQTGTLPLGLTLAPSTGIISGTPTAVGSSTVTFKVTDSGSQFVTRSLTIVINSAVSVTTSTLPNAVSGVAYNTTLAAANGLGGFTWSITSGTLPSGLVLNPATGVISGTTSTVSTANITVRATDTGSNFASANLSLQVLPAVTISTLTLPEGVRNFAYNQTIAATGATNVYTFAVSAGALPAGMTLSPAGLLTGTPSVAGTFPFTVRVTDASTSQSTQQYTLVINASLAVSTATLPAATQGTVYSQALSATGGVLPLTWAILPTSTATQAGFTINPTTGVLSGTPNTFGKLYIDVQLQDFAGNSTTRTLTLAIARNGTSSTDFAVSDASTRIVRMSATGTNLLTVCTGVNCHARDIAADAQGNIYSHDTTGIYKITPGGVVTTLLARSGGVGGVAVDASGNVIFVDNSSDAIYRVTPAGVLTTVGAFPDASSLELQDVFVTLDSGGNYIVGSDAGSTMRIYRFTPAGAVTTLATWSGKGVTGIAVGADGKIAFVDYRNIQLAVFDPAGSPNNVVTYNIPQGEGTLPIGLTIDPANGHYIVPERYARSLYRITPAGAITEMFSGTPLTSPASIAAIPALAAPVISTSSLPGGLAGQNYGSFQLVATGGTGNFTWTATGLAPGLTMSASGVITGGPTAPGTFQVSVTVTDTLTSLTATRTIPLFVTSPIAPVTISSSASQANIALGGTVSASFAAGGGVPPYTFSASGLPQGVSLNGVGALSGSPASPGNFSATIFVSDTSGRSAATGFTITVLGIQISSLPNGTTGVPYSASIGALGGVQPYTFSATGLPAGLGINALGTIAGTPTVGGTFNVGVSVSDGAGARSSAGGSITIIVPGAPVSIPSGALPEATVGIPYSASLSAIGGKTPYSWSVLSGSLPDGLSFGANGIVSGTPTTPGPGGFAALVTDSAGGTASTGASITVKPAPIVITSKSPLASGMLGIEYPSIQLAASGGVAPYKWSVSGGNFPSGIALDAGGTISGTPTVAGDFTATVTVTDAAGTTGSGGFSITIRQVSADLILSSGTAGFELTTGAVALPSSLAIGVQSTAIAQQITFAVVTSPSVPWLTVTNGNKTPDSISIALSSGALSLPAGDYSTTLKVTCSTGSCAGSAQSVAVTLKVTSPPARLKVVTDILSFTTTSQNLAPISQTIAIQNAGGGSLGVASISCGAPWCTVGAPPAALPGGSSANIPITVNPGAVASGFYRTTVEVATSGGKGSVPVTLFIAQNSSMTLSPSGGQFGMPQGGAPGNPSGSFLVSVNSSSAVNFTASQLPGADWLKLGTSSVSASSAQPGTITYSIDAAAASRLSQGAYYGQISVGAAGIVNAPQTYQVILNVTPPTDVARPDPQPAGLLFLTTVGGSNPPPQTVTVFTSSTRAVQFQASATSDGGWLSVSPGLGTTSQPSPAGTTATVNIAGLKQGVYTGLISYAFAGNAVRSVNVTLVVAPVGGTAATLTSSSAGPSISAPLLPRETCVATGLAAVQTGIVSNFSAPAAWPTPLSLRIVDNCGGTVTGAQIVSTFSNGDPPLPLPLVDAKNGVYAGTWTPRKQSATLTISARVTAKGYKDLNMQLIGTVTPNAAPLLTPNGTVHAFSPLVGAPLAPGNIVAVYGSNLAILTGVPPAVPLPTVVNGTQVLIGGIKAPLYFTSPGQVNAQIPYELEPNKQYQVIVSANGALSTPDAIQLTNVVPGLAAYADGTVIAQHADGTLINAKSPAKAGEVAIAYLSGLGATDNNPASGGAAPGDVLARPNSLPTLTVGGKDAKIAFVGLTPGLVGLYQMNFEVPDGLDAGNPKITVTQEGNSSTPVLLPYVPK